MLLELAPLWGGKVLMALSCEQSLPQALVPQGESVSKKGSPGRGQHCDRSGFPGGPRPACSVSKGQVNFLP